MKLISYFITSSLTNLHSSLRSGRIIVNKAGSSCSHKLERYTQVTTVPGTGEHTRDGNRRKLNVQRGVTRKRARVWLPNRIRWTTCSGALADRLQNVVCESFRSGMSLESVIFKDLFLLKPLLNYVLPLFSFCVAVSLVSVQFGTIAAIRKECIVTCRVLQLSVSPCGMSWECIYGHVRCLTTCTDGDASLQHR